MDLLAKTITLRIAYDTDCENPLTACDGMWTLYDERGTRNAFSERGSKTIPDTLDLFWKLRNGLAFIVSGSVHGSGLYTKEYDPEEQIDSYIVWEHDPQELGSKTKGEREEDAQATLDEYCRWVRGECYGWIINEEQPDEDSCWGFVGDEYLVQALREDYLPTERPLNIILANNETEALIDRRALESDGVTVVSCREYFDADRAISVTEMVEMDSYDWIEMGVIA